MPRPHRLPHRRTHRRGYNLTAGAELTTDRAAILVFERHVSSSSLSRSRTAGRQPISAPNHRNSRSHFAGNGAVPNDGSIPRRPAGTFTNVNIPLALARPRRLFRAASATTCSSIRLVSRAAVLTTRNTHRRFRNRTGLGSFFDGECELAASWNQLTFFPAQFLYANNPPIQWSRAVASSLSSAISRAVVRTIPLPPFRRSILRPESRRLIPVSGQPVFAQRLNSVGYAGGSRKPPTDLRQRVLPRDRRAARRVCARLLLGSRLRLRSAMS